MTSFPENKVIASQVFTSENANVGRCEVELWVQYYTLETADNSMSVEYAVRTRFDTFKWGHGKFSKSETSTVASFNTKDAAMADFNKELEELGDSEYLAHRIVG